MLRRLLPLVLLAALLNAPSATAASGGVTDPGRALQWNLDAVGAPAAWRVGTGAGIVVAVVDSGVDVAHEDLVGKLVPGHDFVDRDDDPQDAEGHGTHVSGIIAATANNGRGIAGVAPGAKIMPVRVLDASGRGSSDDVIAGIHWAVDHGAKVINLSLGSQIDALLGPSFGQALRDAWDAGVVPVVAAGNDYITGSGFTDEPALVVSATDRHDASPSYSSGVGAAQWGIAAPGGELPDRGKENAILSTYWDADGPNQYAYLAGTSQAAPHVAAAVAILLSTGRFTPRQAVQRLLDTAHDLGSPGRDAVFGAGRLDLAAAVQGLPSTGATAAAPGPARTPSTVRSATTVTPPGAVVSTVLTSPPETVGTVPRRDSVAVEVPLRRATPDGNDRGRALAAWLAGIPLCVVLNQHVRRWHRQRRRA